MREREREKKKGDDRLWEWQAVGGIHEWLKARAWSEYKNNNAVMREIWWTVRVWHADKMDRWIVVIVIVIAIGCTCANFLFLLLSKPRRVKNGNVSMPTLRWSWRCICLKKYRFITKCFIYMFWCCCANILFFVLLLSSPLVANFYFLHCLITRYMHAPQAI